MDQMPVEEEVIQENERIEADLEEAATFATKKDTLPEIAQIKEIAMVAVAEEAEVTDHPVFATTVIKKVTSRVIALNPISVKKEDTAGAVEVATIEEAGDMKDVHPHAINAQKKVILLETAQKVAEMIAGIAGNPDISHLSAQKKEEVAADMVEEEEAEAADMAVEEEDRSVGSTKKAIVTMGIGVGFRMILIAIERVGLGVGVVEEEAEVKVAEEEAEVEVEGVGEVEVEVESIGEEVQVDLVAIVDMDVVDVDECFIF
jgi:hypothetical protein